MTQEPSSIIDDLREFAAGDVQHSSSLPPWCYVSPAFFQLEADSIFRKEWLCVGRADQIANPGDYYTVELLGEPLVVLRDEDMEVRVLSRVCRHRSMLVIEGAGNTRSFVCPYHTWTYALDERLIGAPEMKRTNTFLSFIKKTPTPARLFNVAWRRPVWLPDVLAISNRRSVSSTSTWWSG